MNISLNALLELQRKLEAYSIKLQVLVDEEATEFVSVTDRRGRPLHKAYDEDSIVVWARGYLQAKAGH